MDFLKPIVQGLITAGLTWLIVIVAGLSGHPLDDPVTYEQFILTLLLAYSIHAIAWDNHG